MIQGRVHDIAKTCWNLLSVLAMAAKTRPGKLLIADQGLAQAIWSARIQHGSDFATVPGLASCSREWISHTLFVHVASPKEVAQERLSRREERTARFQKAESINNLSLWTSAAEIIEDIHDDLEAELSKGRHGGRLMRVPCDDGARPRELAKCIYDQLRQLQAEPTRS
jgi:hypothetical protein